MPAWTQRLRISWRRPLVSFVSQTGNILEDLEREGLLWRYAISDEHVGAKVGDALHQMVFEPGGIGFTLFKPETDATSVLRAAEIAWGRMSPPEARSVEAEFRFVSPLEGTYDELRERAGGSVVPMPGGVRNVDFAVNLDLAVKDPHAQVAVECGIVQQQEARTRLSMNQQALRDGAGVPPSVFDLKLLPEVAVFGRQVWRIADLELASWDDVTSLWSRIRDLAESIDVALFERMKGGTE